MVGEAGYFPEQYKDVTILAASLVIIQIYKFHFRSGVSLNPNKHLEQCTSLRVQPLIGTGVNLGSLQWH